MIYLDNAATTKPSTAVLKKMNEAAECFGNPSSLHGAGQAAEQLLTQARERILSSLGVSVRQRSSLVFCGSGSEANNLALLGAARAKKRNASGRIVISDSEHPSVAQTANRLSGEGFEVVRVTTAGGVIKTEDVISAVNDKTVLISLMLVNNETGALYDVGGAFTAARRINPDVITHCDAVQAYKKVRFTPASLGADLLTVSSHKIHGPKGVGALYIASEILKSKKLVPIIYGGGQENGFRSGTENVMGICGFGEASLVTPDTDKMNGIRKLIIESLPCEARVNLPRGAVCPNIVSVTLPGIKSETMLHYLSAEDICVSSGSACSSRHSGASPVLLSFGLSEREAQCTIRVSIDENTSAQDVKRFTAVLSAGIESLIRTV